MRIPGPRFYPRALCVATLVSAVILVTIVAVPQWLSKGARLDVLRDHVGQIASLAASVVDGDLHAELIDTSRYSDELYQRALAPLVHFHSANPEMFYVYTMVERDGQTYFVLDTATSPDLRVNRKLRASEYMEPFHIRKEYDGDWLEQIASGVTWVTPTFQKDDYGDFLTAHKAIYDSSNRYVGFVGVDFDLQYYLSQESRFRTIGTWSLVAALIASLITGYIVALYHYDLKSRIEQHYHTSMRDGLTGLLNRRGALDAIGRALEQRQSSYATLLVDIDNLKTLNDTHGHIHGDAVIATLASIIRSSIREGDYCARLGGDEFMIFAPECDASGAEEMARRVLAAVAEPRQELAGASFSVSIGIAVRDYSGADFDRLYREADAALYHAKSGGKHRYSHYEEAMTLGVLPG